MNRVLLFNNAKAKGIYQSRSELPDLEAQTVIRAADSLWSCSTSSIEASSDEKRAGQTCMRCFVEVQKLIRPLS